MKEYAVIRRWKDNPDNFQILEYFYTIEECNNFIIREEHGPKYDLEIMTYKKVSESFG